jgi:hypothetical protein
MPERAVPGWWRWLWVSAAVVALDLGAARRRVVLVHDG